MIRLLRSVWNAPAAVPSPPSRVWRDWLVVAIVVPMAIVEGLLRTDLPLRTFSIVLAIAVLPTVLWRRTLPLPMLGIAFVVMSAATLVAHPVQLVSTAYLLLLTYAVFRWGSGRAAIFGLAIMLTSSVLSGLNAGAGLGDAIGGLAVTVAAMSLGLLWRYRAAYRARELDRVRLVEREELARDLHDTVAHHVSAIAVRAQAGLATAALRPEAANEALVVIAAEASRTLDEMRMLVHALRRDGSDPELVPTHGMANLVDLVGGEAPAVQLEILGDSAAIAPPIGAAVYRIAQESITNARRHARHATRIDVTVTIEDERVRLVVHDDGESGSIAEPGFGLTGMSERATLLGGTCAAGGAPGGGWTVTATLPRRGRLA